MAAGYVVNASSPFAAAQLAIVPVYFVMLMGVFYCTYRLVLPALLGKKRHWAFAGLSGVLLVGYLLPMQWAHSALLYPNGAPLPGSRAPDHYLVLLLGLFVNSYGCAFICWQYERAVQAGRDELDGLLAAGRDKGAELERLHGEIALLKSRFNPQFLYTTLFDSHFLYNTLGYFYSKTYMYSAELAGGLMKLSEIMRYSLKETTVAFVPITEEINCLLNLIAIHQLRFENKLQIVFQTEGELGERKILRLVMVALVQNAFWPGSPIHAKNALSIRLSVQTGSTQLSIRSQKGMDNVLVLSEKQIGMIKQRLHWAYGEKYQLGVEDHADHSECTLTIYDDTPPWGVALGK